MTGIMQGDAGLDPHCSARRERRLPRRLSLPASGAALRRAAWLARSAASNLDQNEARLRRSISSLRGTAKALERNRPGPLPEKKLLAPLDALRAIRSSYEGASARRVSRPRGSST